MLMLPEIIILFTAFLLLIVEFTFFNSKYSIFLALLGVASSFLVLCFLPETGSLLGGRFAVDPVSFWFKFIFLVATFLTLSLSTSTFDSKSKWALGAKNEFLAVVLFTLSGMMFLISSRDIISLYVSLETATIPLFALTAWSRSKTSGEGAIKYLAMGALASAFLLYGFGLLYGSTGQMSLDSMGGVLENSHGVWLAAGLLTAGIGFKLALFPFHMWAPDAYQGAPTLVTAFLSVASKAAGLAVAFQIFYRVFGEHLSSWSILVAILASATMTLGNFVAVLQKDIKRFMAYSSISQAGYLILGFLAVDGFGAQAMIFYMLIYVFTNLAAFSVLILNTDHTGKDDLQSLKGFSQTNPLLALALMVALFGLAGIPPLAGFVGKFFLFSVAAKQGFYWLVAVAAINSTISLYYYLRMVRQMYIEAPDPGASRLKIDPLMGMGLGIATIGTVVCGLIPGLFEDIGTSAYQWFDLLKH